MSMHDITLIVNGKPRKLTVKSNELLLNVLRDKLFLTGAKYGCGIAECSACTVLKGDRSIMSCLVPAVAADGWEITTPEPTDIPPKNPTRQVMRRLLAPIAAEADLPMKFPT